MKPYAELVVRRMPEVCPRSAEIAEIDDHEILGGVLRQQQPVPRAVNDGPSDAMHDWEFRGRRDTMPLSRSTLSRLVLGLSDGRPIVSADDLILTTLAETIALHERVKQGDLKPLTDAAAAIVASLRQGGTLFIFGNGGSASDAQHVAAELVGRFQRERAAMAAIALTTDTSVLTGIGNDYSFERIFERQIEALGRRGDVAFGISTSGQSPNVIAALSAARARGLGTIALTGRDGGAVGKAASIHVNVPSESTARTQEVHRTLLHVICDLVERAFL